MSKYLRLTLIVITAAAFILGIVLVVKLLQPNNTADPVNVDEIITNDEVPTNNNPVGDGLDTTNAGNSPVVTPPVVAPPVVNETDDEESVLRLARIFVERFGTFSNRNNFENITNLEPFMTQKLQEEQAAYIDKSQNSGIDEAYYGITTTVISMELVEYTADSTATAVLETRRVESKAQQDPIVFTQPIEVHFTNVGGNWKVSATQWK